jgi:serpin B
MMALDNVVQLSKSNTEFALDLYRKISTTKDDNIFMSPLSISVAIAMTYLGARENTRSQMGNVMHFDDLDEAQLHQAFNELHSSINEGSQSYKLYMANRLFGEKSFAFIEEYLSSSKKHYGAQLQPVDFIKDSNGACSLINSWVSENTAQKIPEIIPAGTLDASTVLVLVNAVYFKGDWFKQFDKTRTQKADFHSSKTETVQVDMMNMMKAKLVYGSNEELKTQVLQLPYVGDRLSMFVILPDPSRSLREVEAALHSQDLVNIEAKFQMSRQDVNVWMPRFKMDEKFSLADILASMGISDAFSPGLANFSGMETTKSLYISQVIHRAVVEVNEEGTEAAAATAVCMRLCAVINKSPPANFRADRPFLFFIRDNRTKAILFIGRLVKP